MPPKTTKNSDAEPDPNHVQTRARNADVHPGTLAKDALRVWNPPRDPDIVEKEKMEKISKKEERRGLLKKLMPRRRLPLASMRSTVLTKQLTH